MRTRATIARRSLMESSLEVHGGSRGMRRWAQRAATGALALCLAMFLGGCGSKQKGAATGGTEKGGASQKATQEAGGAKEAKTGEKSAAKTTSKSAGKSTSKAAEKSADKAKPAEKPATKVAAVPGGGSIRLVDRGCISFVPHWTTIRVGQSLTWHSELKTTVTIHV